MRERMPSLLPRIPKPPNRMRQRASRARACQKVSCFHPNRPGSSQFQRYSTTSPPMKANSTIPAMAAGAIHKSLFLLMLCSSLVLELVVNALQTLPQMKHRVALAREQGVDVDAGLCRQLFEAAPFHFVGDEDVALFVGELFQRELHFVEQHVADVERLRSGVARWREIVDL